MSFDCGANFFSNSERATYGTSNMRSFSVGIAMLLFALPSCSKADDSWNPTPSFQRHGHRCCVISLVDPYSEAVEKLQRLHNGTVFYTDADSIRSVLLKLRKAIPEFVAIVVRPESLDVNLVAAMMKFATEYRCRSILRFLVWIHHRKQSRVSNVTDRSGANLLTLTAHWRSHNHRNDDCDVR